MCYYYFFVQLKLPMLSLSITLLIRLSCLISILFLAVLKLKLLLLNQKIIWIKCFYFHNILDAWSDTDLCSILCDKYLSLYPLLNKIFYSLNINLIIICSWLVLVYTVLCDMSTLFFNECNYVFWAYLVCKSTHPKILMGRKKKFLRK